MTAADPRADHLDELARLVRSEVEVYVREVARPLLARAVSEATPAAARAVATHLGARAVRLGGWCGIASAALVAVYRAHRIASDLAAGAFALDDEDACSHCWVFVRAPYAVPPAQWDAYATIVDITASQFDRFLDCELVRLDPGVAARDLYQLEGIGDRRALAPGDERDDGLHLAEVVHRLEARLGRERNYLHDFLTVPRW